MFEVIGVLATLAAVCYVTWRWLLKPVRDWLDYREKLADVRLEIEKLRTGKDGPDGDRV